MTVQFGPNVSIPGPLEGVRICMMETPVQIYDLSETGCFVSALYTANPGARMTLRITLPHAGSVTVNVEILHNRADYGFVVRFVELSEANQAVLAGAVSAMGEPARIAG